MKTAPTAALALLLAAPAIARGDEPRPVPLTRPEMKRFLEDMKQRTPRIALPDLTPSEAATLDERGKTYEARLRALFLPPVDGFAFGAPRAPGAAPTPGRNSDPNMTLDHAFKTELFWIVSRTNNCQYCLGHQESKLLAAGVAEDEIAALDGDWSEFTPSQRAAFAFARKLTHEPYDLSESDIDSLRRDYKDMQILEMILSIAGNNAINRWKEGAGIPQAKDGGDFQRRALDGSRAPAGRSAAVQTYLTPTSEKYRSRLTRVAPLVKDPATGLPTRRTAAIRSEPASAAEAARAIEAARSRAARLPILDEAQARAALAGAAPEGSLPNWVRLVAQFPREGANRLTMFRAAEEKGDLAPLLKARAAWVIARGDHAWYAAGHARRRLEALGQSAGQIDRLVGDAPDLGESDGAMLTIARNLSASPVVLTDSDVERAVRLAGPRAVVQMIHFTAVHAWFDRVTEAAGLPLDD